MSVANMRSRWGLREAPERSLQPYRSMNRFFADQMCRRALLSAIVLLTGLLSPVSPRCSDGIDYPVQLLEQVHITGNTRTPQETIEGRLGIGPGDPADPSEIVRAVERLRESGLFRTIEYRITKGSARGRLVLELEVQELGVEFRLGAGYEDLSGWYLIPAEVRMDNRLGHGEEMRLHAKLGYRKAGLEFAFEETRLGRKGRYFWGFTFSGFSNDQLYFLNETEYRHGVGRGIVEIHAGRRYGSHLLVGLGAGFEKITVDSTAEAEETNEARSVERGDELPFDDLPPGVGEAAGETRRGHLLGDLVWDSRSARRIAGTPANGLWGRARLEGFLDRDREYAAGSVDLRGYAPLGALSLSGRVRGGIIGSAAPFFDRYVLGGLYTVRGFPNQSLSEPRGETRFWTAGAEIRAPLLGPGAEPRVTAILFLDAGDGWSGSATTWRDVAVGAGYGIRVRVPWLGHVGLDVGFPLTDSPVNESFQLNGSIGWTY